MLSRGPAAMDPTTNSESATVNTHSIGRKNKYIRPSWVPPLPPPDPSLPPIPYSNSYWATRTLLAAEYPGALEPHIALPRLTAILSLGIRDFIDLTHPSELVPYEPLIITAAENAGLDDEQKASIIYQRFAIQDGGVPGQDTFNEIMTAIKESQDAGRMAVVHCWGGIGRTGVIVGSWLIMSGVVKNGDEALVYLAEKWKGVEKNWRCPTTPETQIQFDFLKGPTASNTVHSAF